MHWSDFIQFIMVAAAIKATTGLIASAIIEPRAKCKHFYGKSFCLQFGALKLEVYLILACSAGIFWARECTFSY